MALEMVQLLGKFHYDPNKRQSFSGCCCVGKRLNLFLHSTLSLENLSSGEKRAGCADCVGDPSGAYFCRIRSVLSLSTLQARLTVNSESLRLILINPAIRLQYDHDLIQRTDLIFKRDVACMETEGENYLHSVHSVALCIHVVHKVHLVTADGRHPAAGNFRRYCSRSRRSSGRRGSKGRERQTLSKALSTGPHRGVALIFAEVQHQHETASFSWRRNIVRILEVK